MFAEDAFGHDLNNLDVGLMKDPVEVMLLRTPVTRSSAITFKLSRA